MNQHPSSAPPMIDVLITQHQYRAWHERSRCSYHDSVIFFVIIVIYPAQCIAALLHIPNRYEKSYQNRSVGGCEYSRDGQSRDTPQYNTRTEQPSDGSSATQRFSDRFSSAALATQRASILGFGLL